MQLYPLLYTINPRLTWPGFLVLVFVVLGAAVVKVAPAGRHPGRVTRLLTVCGIIAIFAVAAAEFAFAVRYLFYPSYLDHAEAIDAAVSWLGWQGHPLYPRLDVGDVYGVPYGPLLYQLTGFCLWLLGPSIATSKALGLGAFAASQIVSYFTLRRAGASVAEALVLTAAQCVLLSRSTDQAYVSGVRSDPLLFLIGQLAVLVAMNRPTVVTGVVLGVLGGMAMDLKIHGALYVLPAFVYCLARSPSLAPGIRFVAAALLAGAVSIVLPFLPGNVSVGEYFRYFRLIANDHEWARWLYEKNIVFVAMGLAPLAWIYARFAPNLPRAYRWFLAALGPCMALTAIPAAEPGAGPHHLLPYLPSIFWAIAMMRRAVAGTAQDQDARVAHERITLGLIAALLFGYGPLVLISWGRTLHTFADTPLVDEGIAEIHRALDANPGLKVAVGPGLHSFDAQRLRVIPVFRGNPLPIDPTAWQNFQGQGVSDRAVRLAIRECRVDLWLLPAKAPFVVPGAGGRNAFSPAVLADFHAHYAQVKTGQVFDQWRCTHRQSDSAAVAGPQPGR